MEDEMTGWQADAIVRELDLRRVSFRLAARILDLLLEEPYLGEAMPNQTETAAILRKWTSKDNSHDRSDPHT